LPQKKLPLGRFNIAHNTFGQKYYYNNLEAHDTQGTNYITHKFFMTFPVFPIISSYYFTKIVLFKSTYLYIYTLLRKSSHSCCYGLPELAHMKIHFSEVEAQQFL